MEAELATTKVELEKYSKKLNLQATTDSLTGLANRRRITSLLEKALIEVKEKIVLFFALLTRFLFEIFRFFFKEKTIEKSLIVVYLFVF